MACPDGVPQDFKDAIIITIYKRKGDRADNSGNHRGISLLSIAGKILAISLKTKMKAYRAIVLPTLLYGCEDVLYLASISDNL